jgi:hypothetical protein
MRPNRQKANVNEISPLVRIVDATETDLTNDPDQDRFYLEVQGHHDRDPLASTVANPATQPHAGRAEIDDLSRCARPPLREYGAGISDASSCSSHLSTVCFDGPAAFQCEPRHALHSVTLYRRLRPAAIHFWHVQDANGKSNRIGDSDPANCEHH